jgi:hypothetical protein
MNDLEQNAMNSDFAEEVVNPVLIKNLKEEINMENKYYIIRGDRSGVFFGQIAGRNGQEVELRNVRKLWYWEGACAVEQLAVDGVTNPSDCKFTVVVPEMVITDAIQIIPCSDKAAKNLGEVKR